MTIYTKPLVNAGKAVGWADPSLQRCAKIDQAAGVKFSNPVTVTNAKDNSSARGLSLVPGDDAVHCHPRQGWQEPDRRQLRHGREHIGLYRDPGLGHRGVQQGAAGRILSLYLYRWDVAKQKWVVSSKSYGST